jgi:hypothetical protein
MVEDNYKSAAVRVTSNKKNGKWFKVQISTDGVYFITVN